MISFLYFSRCKQFHKYITYSGIDPNKRSLRISVLYQVTSINYKGDMVIIKDKQGKRWTADKVSEVKKFTIIGMKIRPSGQKPCTSPDFPGVQVVLYIMFELVSTENSLNSCNNFEEQQFTVDLRFSSVGYLISRV